MTIPFLEPFITVAMGAIGLYVTIRHFKVVRTLSYIERMNKPSMAEVRARVDAWLDSGLPDAERLAQLKTDFGLRSHVNIFYKHHHGACHRLSLWKHQSQNDPGDLGSADPQLLG